MSSTSLKKKSAILLPQIDKLMDQQIRPEVTDAVVFADQIFQDLFNWNAINVMNLGAVTLQALDSIENFILDEEKLKDLYELHIHEQKSKKISGGEKESKKSGEENDDEDDNSDGADDDEEFQKWDDDEEEEEAENAESKKEETENEEDKKNDVFNDEEVSKLLETQSLPQKAVFFISELSPFVEKKISTAIKKYKCFHAITIFCSQSKDLAQFVQSNVAEENLDYSDLHERVTFWTLEAHQSQSKQSGNNEEFEPVISIKQIPLSFCTITPNLFVLPSSRDVFPILETKKSQLTKQATAGADETILFKDLSPEPQYQYLKVANGLCDFCKTCGLKAEVVSMGQTAHMVTENLQRLLNENMVAEPIGKATIILIDRTLDLVSPICHSDNMLDRIMNSRALSHDLNKSSREYMSTDVTTKEPAPVDIPSLFKLPHPEVISGIRFSSISHQRNEEILKYLNQLLSSKTSAESISTLRNSLLALLKQEKINVDSFAKPNTTIPYVEQVQQLMQLFSSKPQLLFKYASLLQYLTNLVQAYQTTTPPTTTEKQQSSSSNYNDIMSLEKMLLWTAAKIESHDENEVILQIIDLINEKKKYALRDIFKLLIMTFSSMTKEEAEQLDVDELQQELFREIINRSSTLGQENLGWIPKELESALSGNEQSEEEHSEEEEKNYDSIQAKLEVDERVHQVIRRLHLIPQHRQNLKEFKTLLSSSMESSVLFGSTQGTTPYVSLLRRFASKLAKNEVLEDVKRYTSVLRSFTGAFGRFFSSSSSSNTASTNGLISQDTNIVIIFVIGGLTGSEIVEMQQELNKKGTTSANWNVIYGSTTLFGTADLIYDKVLCPSQRGKI